MDPVFSGRLRDGPQSSCAGLVGAVRGPGTPLRQPVCWSFGDSFKTDGRTLQDQFPTLLYNVDFGVGPGQVRRLLTLGRKGGGWTWLVDLLSGTQVYRFATQHGALENFLTSATDGQPVTQK